MTGVYLYLPANTKQKTLQILHVMLKTLMCNDLAKQRTRNIRNKPCETLVLFETLSQIFEVCTSSSNKSAKNLAHYKNIVFRGQPHEIIIPVDKYKMNKANGEYYRTILDISKHNIHMSFTSSATGLWDEAKQSINGLHFEIEGALNPREGKVCVTLARINGVDLSDNWNGFVDRVKQEKQALPKNNRVGKKMLWWSLSS